MTDLAFGRTTHTSSVADSLGGSLAVDSDVASHFSTTSEVSPWWAVDMGQVYDVTTVVIMNIWDNPSMGKDCLYLIVYVEVLVLLKMTKYCNNDVCQWLQL